MRSSDPAARDSASRSWRAFVIVAVALMAVAACYRLPVEGARLVFEAPGRGAAMDLLLRYTEVREWFAGRPVYGVVESADYPPATYLLLFPFVHWPTPEIARILWALASAAALAALSLVTLRAMQPRNGAERAFAILLPLSMYATAATIRLGQMGVLLLPLLVIGTLALLQQPRSWRRDLLASALLVAAVVKPTFSPPLLWLAFFRGGLRPTLLICGSYVALTLIAVTFQDASLSELLHGWMGQRNNIDFGNAHGNIYSWLDAAGLGRWLIPASLTLLFSLGAWVWSHRDADPWSLLAVSAIVARIWTYHHHYDDLLMLLPLIALFRSVGAAQAEGRHDRLGMVVLMLLWAFSVAPAQALAAPGIWGAVFKSAKTATWLVTLSLLLVRTRRVPAA
jgi:hypothetical protein